MPAVLGIDLGFFGLGLAVGFLGVDLRGFDDEVAVNDRGGPLRACLDPRAACLVQTAAYRRDMAPGDRDVPPWEEPRGA